MARTEIHRDLDRRLSTSDDLAAALRVRVEMVADEGGRTAPRRSGDYAGAFVAAVGRVDGALVGRVGNTDWKAALIEFGTSDTPVFATLRRAAETVGLKVARTGRR